LSARVLKLFQIQGKHPFHDFQARFALLLILRARVNIKGCAATGMPHQLLSDVNVDAKRSEVRREGLTEAVPADLFSNDSDSHSCGANALLQDAVGIEGLGIDA